MPYAEKTTVSVGKTQDDLRRMIEKHGGDNFYAGHSNKTGELGIVFDAFSRRFRITLKMPSDEELRKDGRGSIRSETSFERAKSQAERSSWRLIYLIVKARTECLDAGVETFEQAFLGYTVLPDTNLILNDQVQPQIEQAYKGVATPNLLTSGGST